MEVIIEANIDIPAADARGRWKKQNVKYPIAKLEVKESFWVEKAKSLSLRCTASRYKRLNPGWNYTVRCEKLNDMDGCRIWRTA